MPKGVLFFLPVPSPAAFRGNLSGKFEKSNRPLNFAGQILNIKKKNQATGDKT
jgi:hypothetical protein